MDQIKTVINKTLRHYIYVKRLLQQQNFDSSQLISQSFPVFFEIISFTRKLEMTKIFFLTDPCAISHSPIQLITNSKELSEQGIFLVASFQISDRQKIIFLLKKQNIAYILIISLLRKCQNFYLLVVETLIYKFRLNPSWSKLQKSRIIPPKKLFCVPYDHIAFFSVEMFIQGDMHFLCNYIDIIIILIIIVFIRLHFSF